MRRALKRGGTFVAILLVCAGIASRAGPALIVSLPPRDPAAVLSLASHEWERLPAAAAIARKYPSAVVLLTLPSPVTEQNCHRCAERTAWLTQAGIEATRIHVLPDPVSSTRDEAVASLRYARRARPREIVVITSPYHTRRALATFRHVFEDADTRIAIHPALGESPALPDRWWRGPYDRAYVAYEWAAIVYYGIRFSVFPWNV